MLNNAPDPFYRSEEEKEAAAKSNWPTYLLLLPERRDFYLSEIFKDYSNSNSHIIPESIFGMTDAIENILRSKGLITVGDTGNLMTKITEKGKDLKEGALKHKILSFLFDNSEQTFFRKFLSKQLSIELSSLDYLTEEMVSDNAISKRDCSSKEGYDFFVQISAVGKGFYIKQKYLNEDSSLTQQLPQIIHTYNAPVTSNTITTNGDGNIINQDSHLDKAEIKPTIQNSKNNNEPAAKSRSVIEIISWVVGIIAGSIAVYEFVIKKLL